jgi:hypothetical protein
MNEEKTISRRKYIKYVSAGVVTAVVATAGRYHQNVREMEAGEM